jgi:hypothetical protein
VAYVTTTVGEPGQDVSKVDRARFASSPASTAEITGQDPESAKVEVHATELNYPASSRGHAHSLTRRTVTGRHRIEIECNRSGEMGPNEHLITEIAG